MAEAQAVQNPGENAQRTFLGSMRIPIQLRELHAAVAKGDWNAVKALGAKTSYFEVGKAAVDAAFAAKRLGVMAYISEHGADEVGSYARAQFKQITVQDVYTAFTERDLAAVWYASGFAGKGVAVYAIGLLQQSGYGSTTFSV